MVANNAWEIHYMKTQLGNMNRMLETLVAKTQATGGNEQPRQVLVQNIGVASQTPQMPRPLYRSHEAYSDELDNNSAFAQDFEERPISGRSLSQRRRAHHDYEPTRVASLDRLTRQAYALPQPQHETVADLTEDEDIQRHVSMFLAANSNPLGHDKRGRQYFAHSHITRGKRKSKTGLGELTPAEYTFGLFEVAHCNEGSIKQAILAHIEEVNEDTITYNWEDVRGWSEEVCTRIFEQ